MTLNEFKRNKEFLVCVDSDGCAMDSMDMKHINCFGPCMVAEWNLEQWREAILIRWNQINLYSLTRGINRFSGLAMALTEINIKYCPIDGIEEFVTWTQTTKELSNASVEQKLAAAKGSCFEKALSWSKKVNEEIDALPEDEIKPFDYVREGLKKAYAFADVAVVSSANREAVVSEWQRCGLLDYVDVLCCQNSGTKIHIIDVLIQQGYALDHILIVGDAPGDKAAAKHNMVFYYPILFNREAESWQELEATGLDKFKSGDYLKYEKEKERQFTTHLKGEG